MRYFFITISLGIFIGCQDTGSATISARVNDLQVRVMTLESKIDSLLAVLPQHPVSKGAAQSQMNSLYGAPTYNDNAKPGTYQRSGSGDNPGRCQAITNKGSQCKRPSRSGGHCWQHGG